MVTSLGSFPPLSEAGVRDTWQLAAGQEGRKTPPLQRSTVATAVLGSTGLAYLLPAEGKKTRILFFDRQHYRRHLDVALRPCTVPLWALLPRTPPTALSVYGLGAGWESQGRVGVIPGAYPNVSHLRVTLPYPTKWGAITDFIGQKVQSGIDREVR